MILIDTHIRQRLNLRDNEAPWRRLEIEPAPSDVQFQPCSLDLRLGTDLKLTYKKPDDDYFIARVQYGVTNETVTLTDKQPFFTLSKKVFVLAHTMERVRIPHDLVGKIEGRSSWARKGLVVENAGWIDPGFSGQIVLELYNLSPEPIQLCLGDRICQLTLHQLSGTPSRVYGNETLGSKYQNQTGAQSNLPEKKL